jgi:hypothetical protein
MAVSNANTWSHARSREHAARAHVPRKIQRAAIRRFCMVALAVLATAGVLAGIGALKLAIVLSRFNY